MTVNSKQAWAVPQVQRYGTFEQKTQSCDKSFGANDGFMSSAAAGMLGCAS